MPVHDACKSIYVAIKYPAKTASVWAGEAWQTGFHLLVSGSATPYAVNAGRVTPDSFTAQDASVTRAVTNWNIVSGWVGGGSAPVVTDADIDSILAKINTWATAMKTALGNVYALPEVKLYPMLAGSANPAKAGLAATAPIIATLTNAAAAPDSPNTMPPEVAIAVSLTTGVRGPSGRGRMFTGPMAPSVADASGLVASSWRTTYANAAAALMTGIRSINSGGLYGEAAFTPVVYTRLPNKAGFDQDTGSVISGVRVSDEFDVQRRRQHQRNDTYTSAAVT
jgi:hypothetical protein